MSEVGLCQCGCGQPAPVAPRTVPSRGWVKGEPRPFRTGHNKRKTGPEYQVDPVTGCWDWLKYKDERGYGIAFSKGKLAKAHRVYFERYVGPVPDRCEVDHLCRNHGCVNPDHLEAVPHQENVWRGRLAKITIEDARAIRRLATGNNPPSPARLAEQFGISRNSIYAILSNRTWREAA
jgi:hypothetical protein